MNFIFIQGIGLLAWGIFALSYWAKDKKHMLLIQVISDSLSVVHYLLLGALAGTFMYVLNIISDIALAYCKNSKQEKIVFFILVPFFILVGMVSYSTWIDIFPVLASVIYCFTLTLAAHWVVLGGIIDALYWLVYDFMSGSISGVISDSIIIISNTINLFHRKNEYDKKKRIKDKIAKLKEIKIMKKSKENV